MQESGGEPVRRLPVSGAGQRAAPEGAQQPQPEGLPRRRQVPPGAVARPVLRLPLLLIPGKIFQAPFISMTVPANKVIFGYLDALGSGWWVYDKWHNELFATICDVHHYSQYLKEAGIA